VVECTIIYYKILWEVNDVDNINAIASKIRKYRKEQNMSQDELSARSGINVSTIKKYEIGYRNPKTEQLIKISAALGVSINEFMDFEISTISDVMSLIMKLDKQTNMKIEGQKDKKGNYVPCSISITFTDEKINDALAIYLSYKEKSGIKKDELNSNDITITHDDLILTLENTKNSFLFSTENIDKN